MDAPGAYYSVLVTVARVDQYRSVLVLDPTPPDEPPPPIEPGMDPRRPERRLIVFRRRTVAIARPAFFIKKR